MKKIETNQKTNHRKLNYKLMLSSNAIAYFVFQLIGPFFVLFINQKGGSIEQLGLLFGVSILANSITAFCVGHYSDKIGRKPFLLVSSFVGTPIIIAYLYVTNLFQLYLLQIIGGINNAAWNTSETIFMADITNRKTRGKMMGLYNLVLGILMAAGLMLGGFAIGKLGFQVMFWFVGIANLFSAVILFFVKEKR